MNKKITIAIDAMGGENSPDKIIKAVSLFNKKNISKDDYVLNLFGDEKLIQAKLDNKDKVAAYTFASQSRRMVNLFQHHVFQHLTFSF